MILGSLAGMTGAVVLVVTMQEDCNEAAAQCQWHHPNAAVLTVGQVAHRRVLCPACMEKEFERWPEGWDAHAAHRCKGLESETPQSRKAEFKLALGHLFGNCTALSNPRMQPTGRTGAGHRAGGALRGCR